MTLKTRVRPGLGVETVRTVTWQSLLGLPRVPPGRVEALAREAGGVSMTGDPFAKVPLASFNAALARLDAEAGRGEGVVVAEAARAYVGRWAEANGHQVSSLRGDPARMMELVAREVLPFLLDSPSAVRLLEADKKGARVALESTLLEPFKEGLLASFVELTGCRARVTRDSDVYVVWWEYPEDRPAGVIVRFLQTIRAPFLAATVVPVLLGAAVALWQGAFDGGWFALGLLGALLVHVGTNTANDWFDHRSGADTAEPRPGAYGGRRMIQRGLVSSRIVAAVSILSFAAAIALGLWMTAARGWGILALGVVGVALGLFYTLPSVRLRARGLGEVAVALGFGPVLVLGAYYLQAQRFDAAPLMASLPLAALVAAVLVLNRPDARSAHAALVATAFALLVAGVAVGVLPAPALLALVAAPLGLVAARALPARPSQANATTVVLHLTAGLLLALGFVATRWVR